MVSDFVNRIWRKINRLLDSDNRMNEIIRQQYDLKKDVEIVKIMLGKLLSSKINIDEARSNIHKSEFKVFSQWGDDGIIQFLIQQLQIQNKVFVEFGVENYKEANTKFLLLNNNWTGLVIDGSRQNINDIYKSDIYRDYDLKGIDAFVNAENINEVIESAGIKGEIGLLHIDIDGNDYWVWKAIKIINPIIVIVEYNAVFGSKKSITIPYEPDFFRTSKHYSNLYFGASLKALCYLGNQKGYGFVGCNSNGNNAYFIKRDYISIFQELDPDSAFVNSRFRESRDVKGDLTYISGAERIESIRGMPVLNVISGIIEYI